MTAQEPPRRQKPTYIVWCMGIALFSLFAAVLGIFWLANWKMAQDSSKLSLSGAVHAPQTNLLTPDSQD